MTNASRHFSAKSRFERDGIARFGTIGSITLWAITLAGAPFYVIVALAFGLAYTAVDRARTLARSARTATGRLIGGALPVADNLAVLLNRLRVSVDEALRPLIQRRSDRVVISLPRTVAFSEGEAVPLSGARDLLARLAGAVEAGAWRIDVIGYADGSTSRNPVEPQALDLSSRRARAAVDALRAAGCRGPIAVLGSSGARDAIEQTLRHDAGQSELPALDIVIRGQKQGHRDAA